MKRQTRIITLLVIDSVFFFVEIIVGINALLFNSADDD
jgi:Co/Zn/Cd efflux system component